MLPIIRIAALRLRNLKPNSIKRFFHPCTTRGLLAFANADTNSEATDWVVDNINSGKSRSDLPAF